MLRRGRRRQGNEGQVRPGPQRRRQAASTRRRGVIVRCSNDGIAIAPPLIITREQTAELAGIVAETIHEVLG